MKYTEKEVDLCMGMYFTAQFFYPAVKFDGILSSKDNSNGYWYDNKFWVALSQIQEIPYYDKIKGKKLVGLVVKM